MKPAPLQYSRPRDIREARELLTEAGGVGKVLAGGQSLGPMMNLRLALPELLVDIASIPELGEVREEDDAIVYGACITHSAVEDGRVPDATHGFLRRVAAGIAYRAVRNRGTMGGSIAHADPAADWITILTALDAEIIVAATAGEKRIRLEALMTGPFTTVLDENEIIAGIRIRRWSPAARFGYFKFCRKKGEFAEAMTAIAIDPEAGIARAAIGATDSRPTVLGDVSEFLSGGDESLEAARQAVLSLGIADDPIADRMHANAFTRALRQVEP